MKRALAITVATLTLIQLSPAAPDQWPHWRGPTGNGVAPAASPPLTWSESENVAWKVAVPGEGSASPVVWDDRIFVSTAIAADGGKQRFVVLCYDRQTGEVLWEQTASETVPAEGHHEDHGFASASPMTDGTLVYAHFGTRGLFAFTVAGEPVWSFKDFGPMTTRNSFGEGSSPTLHGGKIIVPWDHEGDSYLMAIGSSKGNALWKRERDEPTSWGTPLVANGQIIMTGENYARGYDFETGAEIWRCAGQTSRPVASPVANDTLAFIGSGFRGAYLGAFRYRDARGDIGGTDAVAWSVSKGTPDIASLVLSGDLLYYTAEKSSLITCCDASTGEIHFDRERPEGIGNIYASPIAANGHVYIFGRNGKTAVIRDGTEFAVVATNELADGIDATPAFVGGDVIVRTTRHLYRISSN